tara:strand:- start:244883 stop:245449 length:567 start_codon:yes stop_codon:yes gene_type:complete
MSIDPITASVPLTTAGLTTAGLFAAVVLGIASVTDIRNHKVHNWLTYPAVLMGFALAWLPIGSLTLTQSLTGCLGCGALMLLPYVLSGGGAGDVKLAMAVGSLVGFQATLQGFCVGYFVAAAFILLRYATAWLASIWQTRRFQNRWFQNRSTTHESSRISRFDASAPIPLSGFFACGMLNAYLLGPLW